MINKDKYQKSLKYIKEYWPNITYRRKKDCGVHIGLPNTFVAPSDNWFLGDQFYWDSYFNILGLLAHKKVKLSKGIVDNFIHLFKKYNIIPSRNRYYNLGISQPPFLTSMALEIYEKDKDKRWLKSAMKIAEEELYCYWTGEDHGIQHLAFKGLSRYSDHHMNDITAEHESGWDMTSRFNNRCQRHLPIDLNCLLYKYEIDLMNFYQELGDSKKSKEYKIKANRRKQHINELMWSEKRGFFFDYNYVAKEMGSFYSLAGFFPLWCGLATEEQAEKVRKNLKKFEYEFGLAATQKGGLSENFKQWDYPNGWAPLHWIVFKGLKNYGFDEDAERIAEKWLELNRNVFNRTGKFWERYNVVSGKRGHTERYPIQWGFGWTNAIFVKLYNELTKGEKNESATK